MLSRSILEHIRGPEDVRRLSPAELRRLADEVRARMIQVVSQTGGHLGAGLGVVELTVALHHVFDTPTDRLLWDVGHQSYPHKMLTGRLHALPTIRQGGGLSGFTRRAESHYDVFGAGHSSTSIAAALGMAVGRDLKGERHHVVAVIGDGAMSAGLAFEALNNAGALSKRVIVVLNDNGMSIAPAVGALSQSLAAGQGAGLFRALGFDYEGPIDGHDLDALVAALSSLRDRDPAGGPVILHLRTEKGRGWPPAEASIERGHGVGKFDPISGVEKAAPLRAPSQTSVFAQALIAEAEDDLSVLAITAGMPSGTGLDKFARRYPGRCFDVGIAEQHAVTFAAGLACDGWRPFCAIYSTFLQRAYDQVVHDVALQSLPVRFVLDRAGLVGPDGATHNGAFDLPMLCALPNMVVMAPSDEAELMHMVATAARIDDRPSAIRFPRGVGLGVELPPRGVPLPIGKGRILRRGASVALLALGNTLEAAMAAAEQLTARGYSTTVADARFAKPIDEELVTELAENHRLLITLEEGAAGGFGAWVLGYLARQGLLDGRLRVRQLTLPDEFIEHDTQEEQRKQARLTASDIVTAACGALGPGLARYRAGE